MNPPVSVDDYARRELPKFRPFSDFAPEAIEEVVIRGRVVRVPLGHTLIPPNQKGEGVWFLMDGRVRLLTPNPANKALPETIELLEPGAWFGACSQLFARPLEFATAAADVVCFILPETDFAEWFRKDATFAAFFEHRLSKAQFHGLLAAEFQRLSKDPTSLLQETLRLFPMARLVSSASPEASGAARPEDSGLTWVCATPAAWGRPWTPEQGDIRRVGFAAVHSDKITYALPPTEAARVQEPPATLEIEQLLDQRKLYPDKRVDGDAAKKITACFEILALQARKRFPRDAVHQVLTNELRRAQKPSLHICGSVAAIAGFNARLVEVPGEQVAFLEAPCLLYWNGEVTVLLETTDSQLVLSSPTEGLLRLDPSAFVTAVE